MSKAKEYNDPSRQIIWDETEKDAIKKKYTFPHKDCPVATEDDPKYLTVTKHGNLWCHPVYNEGCGETIPYNSFKKIWDDELQLDVPNVPFKFVKNVWKENRDLRESVIKNAEIRSKEKEKIKKTLSATKKKSKNFKKVKSPNIIKVVGEDGTLYELRKVEDDKYS
jgi:hypothetical protein